MGGRTAFAMDARTLALFLLTLPALCAAAGGCAALAGSKGYPVSDHYDGRRFRNPDGPGAKSTGTVLRWLATRDPAPWPERVDAPPPPPLPKPPDAGELQATFVNHATVLFRTPSANLLTDPNYADRVGPWDRFGPKRVRPPGVPFDALPRIDVVLVSHNHYDHLHLATLRRLEERDRPLVLAPLGNRPLLEEAGMGRIEELDWWESREVADGVRVTLVPARHWSGRGLFDRNRALWGGFVVEAEGRTVYFAGDTGYGDLFLRIRERFPPIDLALLPIGSYAPRWFMGENHLNPEEAVRAHGDLGARRTVGIHFGTFRLSDEPIDEPPARLEAARVAAGLSNPEVKAPAFGETFRLR